MFIVTNHMKVKKGFAEKMAPKFTQPGPLQEMKGFVKTEVAITQNLTEHDEISVNMYWETMEDFEAWKNSDLFKEAHNNAKRPEESPLIDNEIIIQEVASVIEAK